MPLLHILFTALLTGALAGETPPAPREQGQVLTPVYAEAATTAPVDRRKDELLPAGSETPPAPREQGQVLAAGPAVYQEGEVLPISYREALQYALEHSIEMRQARVDLEIADKSIWEITASGLPQVDASLNYQYFFQIPTQLVPAEFFGGEQGEFVEIRFGTEQNMTAQATVSQMIFDGSYIVGLRASRIYRQLAQETLERSELEVRNRVAETYFLVLLTSDNLSINRESLSNMERILAENEILFKEGFTDQISVDQLRLSVSNMRTTLNNLERQYELTMNLLKFQMGVEMEREIRPVDSLDDLFADMIKEADLAVGEEFDHEEHIDYRIMLSRQMMDFMALRREQSFSLPRITASLSYQEMAMRDEFNFIDRGRPWFPSSFLAVNMTIPIFSSGERSSRINQARLELLKAELATQQVAESLKLQIAEARARFRTAREQYHDESENLDLAERIFSQTTVMHREGLATSLELTQAQNQLLSTRSRYFGAMFDLINARNELEKARGLY
jgi:outer membrane protein